MCYFIGSPEIVDFNYIKKLCVDMGSDLIRIDSATKQISVQQILGKLNILEINEQIFCCHLWSEGSGNVSIELIDVCVVLLFLFCMVRFSLDNCFLFLLSVFIHLFKSFTKLFFDTKKSFSLIMFLLCQISIFALRVVHAKQKITSMYQCKQSGSFLSSCGSFNFVLKPLVVFITDL